MKSNNMKTLEHHFLKEQARRPNLGDYSCLYYAVKGKHFNEETISRWFTILVNENNYERSDRRELVRQLVGTSNTPLRSTEFD